jgi:hypothetical protein
VRRHAANYRTYSADHPRDRLARPVEPPEAELVFSLDEFSRKRENGDATS